MFVEATASVNVNNNSKLKALLAAGTAGAAMLGVGLMGTTAHADTLVDANHVQVDAGDTLSAIAHKHNTTVDQLAKDNNISDVNMIHVGDKLVISPNGQNDDNVSATTNASVQATGAGASQNTAVNTGSQAVSQQGSTVATTGNNGGSSYTSGVSGSEAAAKEWIAQHESGGSYGARNGQYIGRYQLSAAYLNGDYSPANQERVADQYVAQRYGGWQQAQAHWMSAGWY